MKMLDRVRRDYLRRLPPGAYRGRVAVHWSMTMADRRTGWLTPSFAQSFRELLLHSCSRYHALCPIYCLMPDHIHLLVQSYRSTSDQRLLAQHFRKHLQNQLPPGIALQKQAFDHVLRAEEQTEDAFHAIAFYIRDNPVRGQLVQQWQDYGYVGSLVPGYPEFQKPDADFWQKYWRVLKYLQAQDDASPPA